MVLEEWKGEEIRSRLLQEQTRKKRGKCRGSPGGFTPRGIYLSQSFR